MKIWKKKLKLFFPSRVFFKYQSFKNRWRCVKQHCIIIHTYIYQTGASNSYYVRIWGNWLLKLAVVGDNTDTSWLVILVLPPSKYNSSVVQFFKTNNLKLNGPWLWWVIIKALPGWWYLYYHPANVTHQLCGVLTNNLILNGPIW